MIKAERPLEMFTKYEKARMIGARALQISQGAPMLVKLTEEDLKRLKYNPVAIAKLEFDADVIPLEIRRVVAEKKPKKE